MLLNAFFLLLEILCTLLMLKNVYYTFVYLGFVYI